MFAHIVVPWHKFLFFVSWHECIENRKKDSPVGQIGIQLPGPRIARCPGCLSNLGFRLVSIEPNIESLTVNPASIFGSNVNLEPFVMS